MLSLSDSQETVTAPKPAITAKAPVQWGSFQVSRTATGARIEWTTLQESQTQEFLVQRSVNGRQYTAFRRLEATGDSKEQRRYQAEDPQAGETAYYRLICIGRDGSVAYSKPIESHADISSMSSFQ